MNNKVRKWLSVLSAAAIIGTSLPLNVIAQSGGADNVRATTSSVEIQPKLRYKWDKYGKKINYKTEYSYKYVKKFLRRDNTRGECTWTCPNIRGFESYALDSGTGVFTGVGEIKSISKIGDYDYDRGRVYRLSNNSDTLSNGESGRYLFEYSISGVSGTADTGYVDFVADIYESNYEYTPTQVFSHYSKGTYVGEETSSSRNTYPDNNYSGNYWYVYKGSEVAQTIADQFTPQIQSEKVSWGKTINLRDNITNLPTTANITDITSPAINTKEPGNHNGKVRITFSDQSTKEVIIPVEVSKSESQILDDKIKNQEVTITKEAVDWGKTINLTDNIPGVTSDKVTDITSPKIDTKKSGEYVGRVSVTFDDTSTGEYTVSITVNKSEAENFTPAVNNLEAKRTKTVDITSAITNKPSNASVVVKQNVTTESTGQKTGIVTINFADGSTKDVNVPVNVVALESDTYKVTVEPEVVKWGGKVDLTNNVTNLPIGAKVVDITETPINTKEPGEHTGKIRVDLSDGSSVVSEVSVTVQRSEAETFQPTIKEIIGRKGETVNIIGAVTNLPIKAVANEKTPVNTDTVGEKEGVIKITFADGSEKDVTIKARIFDPYIEELIKNGKLSDTIKEEVVNKGGKINLTDNINVRGVSKVTDITSSAIDTNVPGQYVGKVRVEFEDTQVAEADVTVIVLEDADGLRAKITELEGKLAKAESDKNALNQQITDLNARITELENSGKAKDAETAKLKADKAKLEDDLNKANAKVTELGNEVKSLKEQIITKDNKIEELNNKITDLENQVKKLKDDNTELQKKLDKANADIQTLTDANNTLTDKNTKLEEQVTKLEETIRNKESEITKLTEQINGLNDSIKKLQEKVDGLNDNLDKANKDLADKQAELEKLQKELQDKINKLNDDIAKKEKEGEDLQKQLDDEKAKIDANETKISELEDKIKKNQEEQGKLNDEKAALQEEIDKKQTEINNLQDEKTKLENDIKELNKQIKDLVDGKTLSEEEVAKLKKDLEDAQNRIKELEKQLEEANKDNLIKDKKIKELEDRIKELNKTISELNNQVTKLDSELTDSNNQIDQRDGVIRNLEDKLKGNVDIDYLIGRRGYDYEYNYRLEDENRDLREENRDLKDRVQALDDLIYGRDLGLRTLDGNTTNKVKYVFTIGSKDYLRIDGNRQTSNRMDVAPYIKNDRTMMPLRYVADAIGADVKWDNNTRTAYFIKNGLVARIQIDGNKIELSNGRIFEMDSKPDNVNNRILVSLTNVSKVFNLTNGNTEDGVKQDIEWNNSNKTVNISLEK